MLPSLIQTIPWDAEANSIATALVNMSLLQPNSPRESDEVRSVAHAHDWRCFPSCSRRFGKEHAYGSFEIQDLPRPSSSQTDDATHSEDLYQSGYIVTIETGCVFA